MAEATAETLVARAHELHAERRTDDAIAAARAALALDAEYIPALTYLGTTLVTRKLAFEEGLSLLKTAARLTPEDPGVLYSLGWCYEFTAYRLEKSGRTPYRDPIALYESAADCLRRVIDLKPEQKLVEDAEDLLASIEQRL